MRNLSTRRLLLALSCALFAADTLAQSSVTFQYFYDETGQLTRVVDSTGVILEYVYDPTGNRLEVRRSTSAGQLTVLGLTPAQGRVGALIEIQGQGFAAAASANVVRFNGNLAEVVSATANRLLVLVPAGASTGPVTVTVAGSTAPSPTSFTVLVLPAITSITPRTFESAQPPGTLQVTGSNLSGASFSLVPAFIPPSVTLGVPQINLSGTVATLPLTVTPSAVGLFVLVATNSSGSSDSLRNPGNSLGVIGGQGETDSDGDGFPDGLELLLGSDPFDADRTPNLEQGAAREAVSRTLSFRNLLVPDRAGPAAREAVSPPVSVWNLNATPPSGAPAGEALSANFSVLNAAGVVRSITGRRPRNGEPDSDRDGLSDLEESEIGTDGNNPDTDGDGLSDGDEVALGTKPLDPTSPPAETVGRLISIKKQP